MTKSYADKISGDNKQFLAQQGKFVTKSSQQRFLEKLLKDEGFIRGDGAGLRILDLACGSGALSFHLREHFPKADFVLLDLNQEALAEAQKLNPYAWVETHNLYDLPESLGRFDLIFCWQTLSWVEDPKKMLGQIHKVLKPGGVAFLSSLFNFDHNADIFARIHDHERGVELDYNTFSFKTIEGYLAGLKSTVKFHRFDIDVELKERPKGVGTYTLKTDEGRLLQVSAGHLMNWGIMELKKS